MKRIITASLVATLALTSVNASSTYDRINDLETELAKLKKKVKKQNKKINEVKAHDAGDNIKWGADVRTAIDHINYDMADGSEKGKSDLMSLRLWLNMAYAPDANNVFKGQLAMNKAFGARFTPPGQFDHFDWTANESLTDNHLAVRQAYWLYLGEKAFGADIPWTFSLGRRPSTGGFLANLREDDAAQSPLGHIINVEFDGLSSKLDLSKVTGVAGMSIKLCMGQGSTDAQPLIGTPTPSATVEAPGTIDDIKLAGFIFEPYNDGQFITKATWFRAYDLPDMTMVANPAFNMSVLPTDPAFNPVPVIAGPFEQVGDMEGGAFSVLVDGLTEEGYFSDAKVFGSIAYSKTSPDAGYSMLGSPDSETGTSYWVGAQLPVTVEDENYGVVGLEYNHGDEYWRPFTYAEDTMVGSKLAARGDAWEAYYTYHFNEALSAQVRYTKIDYDYTGSNGFFGSVSGNSMKISDVKDAAGAFGALAPADQGRILTAMNTYYATGTPDGTATLDEMNMAAAAGMVSSVVETAEDVRFYIRYRF
jgi:hypothetical protein